MQTNWKCQRMRRNRGKSSANTPNCRRAAWTLPIRKTSRRGGWNLEMKGTKSKVRTKLWFKGNLNKQSTPTNLHSTTIKETNMCLIQSTTTTFSLHKERDQVTTQLVKTNTRNRWMENLLSNRNWRKKN